MKVAVRADSGTEIGVGHIMRSLSLIDQLADQFAAIDVLFICRSHSAHLAKMIEERGYSVKLLKVNRQLLMSEALHLHKRWVGETLSVDAQQTADAILERWGTPADWIILDHYGIDLEWEEKIAKYVKRIMVIDDLADRRHHCDLLLDQTYGEPKDRYDELIPIGAKALIGARYALLRKEFDFNIEEIRKDRSARNPKNLLISLGGGDPENFTGQVLDAIHGWRACFGKITVVLGHANPNYQFLRRKAYSLNVEILQGVDNIAEIILSHDLAIGASGISTWERCALGMPTVAIQTADNQKVLLSRLNKTAAISKLDPPIDRVSLESCLRPFLDVRENYIDAINKCFEICDSKGAHRVVAQLLNLSIQLKRAESKDCEIIFSLQSCPGVRKFFRNPEVPNYQEHLRWFEQVLQDSRKQLFLIECVEEAVGVLRLDNLNENEYEISILLDPKYQGLGFASRALTIIKERLQGVTLRACVHQANRASQVLFKRLGFEFDGLRYNLKL